MFIGGVVKEYNNDAEKLISGISINYDDEDIETGTHALTHARTITWCFVFC